MSENIKNHGRGNSDKTCLFLRRKGEVDITGSERKESASTVCLESQD